MKLSLSFLLSLLHSFVSSPYTCQYSFTEAVHSLTPPLTMNESTNSPEPTTPSNPSPATPKLGPSPFPNSPTASTAPTLHHATSSPNLHPNLDRASKYSDAGSDCDTYWRPSSSLEVATAIPQPAFAVRLTLTRPLQIRTRSSQSFLQLQTQSRENLNSPSPRESTFSPSPLREKALEALTSGRTEDEKEQNHGPSVFSIGSHGTNPLSSHPPNPMDTIRYSVVDPAAPRNCQEEDDNQKRRRRNKIRQKWQMLKEQCSGCFREKDGLTVGS